MVDLKKKKGLILGIGLAILVIAAALAAILLFGGKEAPKLAWNPDMDAMQDGTATRVPDENGYFSIRLWVDGQETIYRTKDASLVATLDGYRVLQIEADQYGNLKKAVAPESKRLSYRDLVQQVKGDRVLLNSSIAFNGAEKELKLAEKCKISDVSGDQVSATQPEIMDEVLVYGNESGEATHIFIMCRQLPAKLYWRIERKYDSRSNGTTRQPDENGIYTVLFATEGVQTELKCRDKALVDLIDRADTDAGAMGIMTDAEGYITEVKPVYKSIQGREICSLYNIKTVNGDTFQATNKQDGSTLGRTMDVQLAADCKIYNVSSGAILKGEPLEDIQPGDLVTAYSDAMGIVRYIYVHVRLLDSRLYFNLEQMYKNGGTTRQPDADGWYVFQMLSDGQVLTLKTQDPAVAEKIDSISSRGMGLELEGDVILRAFGADCVTGNDVLAAGQYIKDISGALVTTTSTFRGRGAKLLMLHKDYKVYDVSGNFGLITGEETQLREGDRIYAFGTADREASHIFVVGRSVTG